jgi:putative membrane protein
MSMRTKAAMAMLGGASLLVGCTGLPPNMAMGGPPARAGSVKAAPFTAVERDFVMKVVAQGMYEVEVSRLAAERALDRGVREYAQTLVRQHGQSNNELVAMMSARGIAPPPGLAADKATKLHKLAALPRSDAFDNGYVRVVGVEDHRAAIAMFEKARHDVRDPQLRDWIDRTLGIMRNHLAMAQSLVASMNG